MQMLIYRILIGAVLLCLGRKLFWLFVGALGFVMASEMTVEILKTEPAWIQVVIAVVAGSIGVILAITLQEVAIAVSGFMAGGYFLTILLQATSMRFHEQSWIGFVIGGIVGALLMLWMFDPALIVLSSATGAHLILQSFHLSPALVSGLFLVLFVSGIVFQVKMLKPRLRK